MPVIRQGNWEVSDYTQLTELFERELNVLEGLNLFEAHYGTTTRADVERITDSTDAIKAKERGADRNYAGREKAFIETFRIPFFPLDNITNANEVQDFREYGQPDTPASVERRVERALARISRSHDKLRRKAMYQALKGTTYAPDMEGTQYDKTFSAVFDVAADMYAGGGIDFTNSAQDPSLFVEKNCREHIQDKAKDNAQSYEIVVLCGSGFFNSLVHHPLIIGAYDQYASDQEPLRNRLGGNALGRVFRHKSVTYIEDVSTEIPRGDAFVIPMGIDGMFQIHYAPADTLDHANTVAEEAYIFLAEERRKAVIETETSFVCVNTRPELICELTGNTLLSDA
ncbi:putative major capsid protein [Pseudoalteromonas phage J2-1_QLiu-2017]|nr:putative major capsid protein [Pseudoalteromonas phage J2-1_QLiu-2017]